jgi:hypothetical protein
MRGRTGPVVRVLLLAGAAGAVVLLVSWQHREDRCADARRVLFFAPGRNPPPPRSLDRAVRDVKDTCDAEDLRTAVNPLAQAGDRRAVPLAREVVHRQPEDFKAWGTLSVALARTDPAGAERARRHAFALNPLLARPRGR